MQDPDAVSQDRVVGVVAKKELEEEELQNDVEKVEKFDGHVSEKEKIAERPPHWRPKPAAKGKGEKKEQKDR